MRFVIVLALVTACTRANPDHCDVDTDCATGLTCALPSHACVLPADAATVTDSATPGCVGNTFLQVCPVAAPTGSLTLSGSFDTGTSMICSSSQLWKGANTDSCFVVGDLITVMDLKVTGPRPLVLLANDVNVVGNVDVASHVWRLTPADSKIGPGSDGVNPCGVFSPPAVARGGGGGATFATPGQRGGVGGGGDPTNGGNGGSPPQPDFIALPPDTLRAGCRGETGGTGSQPGGAGGYGGGALYVVATQSIAVGASAIINASGAGGADAGTGAGGGGGGSGGMIILHAASFSIMSGAIVVANGGSGSTGGTSTGGGVKGSDPDPTTPQVPAYGPTGGGRGGDGFAQSSSAVTAATGGGNNGLAMCGGGGGGGAGGYIQSNMALTKATVSPASNIVP